MLCRSNGNHDLFTAASLEHVKHLVTGAEQGNLVNQHPGGGLRALGGIINRNHIERIGSRIEFFNSRSVISRIIRCQNPAAHTVCLRADAVLPGRLILHHAQDDLIIHAGQGLPLLAHDVGRREIQRIHIHLVVFFQRNRIVKLALPHRALAERNILPFNLLEASFVLLHFRLAIGGHFDGLAGTVGMNRHIRLHQLGILLNLCLPLRFPLGAEHLCNIWGKFHAPLIAFPSLPAACLPR